ncbi:hypothetical protein Emag_005119 [Eimeria magna]
MAASLEAEGSHFELPLSSAASLCGVQEGSCLHDGGASPSERQPQLVYERSLRPAADGLLSVTALACSPDGSRVGVATKDRLLHLVGGPENTDEVFPARPADKGKPCQLVTGVFTAASAFTSFERIKRRRLRLLPVACTQGCKCMHAGLAFNYDGSLLAVSQSDGVTHVYAIKQQEARRVCRRLPVGSPATCLAWAVEERRLLFIGLLNGKVRVADVEANKLGALHEAQSPVTSLACTADGLLVASGHRNGQVLLHNLQPGAPHSALVTLTQLAAPVVSIQLREEGVACAAGDKIILLTRGGAKLRELGGIAFPALIAWHPTAPWLVAASGENVWLLSTSLPLVDEEAGSSKGWGPLLARPLQAEACCRVLHRPEERIERLEVQTPLVSVSNAGQLVLAWTARGFLAASLASGKRYELAGSVGEEATSDDERGGVSSIPNGEQKSLFHSDQPVRWLGLGDSVLVLLDGEGQLRSVPLEEATREPQHRDRKAAFLGTEALLVAQQEHTLCIWYNVEAPEMVDALQVEGVLLRLEESSQTPERKGEKSLTVVTRKAFGVEERHPLCPLRRRFERCLRLEDYEEAVTLLSNLPESRATTKLWRRLGACALNEEFLSTCLQGSDAVSPACMQRVAVAAWAAASAGEAADAWFLRKMLKTQGLLGDSNESARNALHLKAGSVLALPHPAVDIHTNKLVLEENESYRISVAPRVLPWGLMSC